MRPFFLPQLGYFAFHHQRVASFGPNEEPDHFLHVPAYRSRTRPSIYRRRFTQCRSCRQRSHHRDKRLRHSESDGRSLIIPFSAFTEGNQMIARCNALSHDVLVMRLPNNEYRSLYLSCTHEDQPLTVTSTGLHCPSHGSRSSLTGDVEEGPVTKPLRSFPVGWSKVDWSLRYNVDGQKIQRSR